MKRDELLKFVQTRINNNLSAAVRQNVYDYLQGKRNDIIIHNGRISTYYGFIDTIQAELDGESADMAERCMKLCAVMSPRVIIEANYSNSKRYALYQKAGLDFNFVKKDMVAAIERNMYNHLGAIDSYRVIKSARQHYDEFESYIYDKGDVTLPHLVMIACGIMDNLSEHQSEVEFLEKWIYSYIKSMYKSTKVRIAIEESGAGQAVTDFYDQAPGNTAGYDDKLHSLLFVLCRLAKDMSPLILGAGKVVLALSDEEFLFARCERDIDKFVDLYSEYDMPVSYTIEAYAYYDTMYSLYGVKIFCGNKLKKLCSEHRDEFIHTLKKVVSRNSLKGAALYRVLWKNGADVSGLAEYGQRLEKIIAEKIEKTGTFNCVKDRDLPYTVEDLMSETLNPDLVLTFKRSGYGYNDVMIACAVMFDCSYLCRNALCAVLSHDAYNRVHLLSAFVKIDGSYSDDSAETFEKLYRGGVTLANLAVTYSYSEAYDSFNNFILAHRDEAADALDDLLKKGVSCEGLISLMYDTDKGFDYSKLRILFDSKLKTTVAFIEDLCRSQEANMRPYVEDAIKKAPKNGKEAAMRLIKLWDAGKTEAELAAINSVEKLTEYIQGKYLKSSDKYIPYADEINTGAVKVAGEDSYAPEVLVKYYLSEYMMLKDPGIVKPCEKIKGFLDHNDLRILTQDIYSLWMSKGAEAKMKNVLLAYCLNLNDGDIMSLKKQIDEWTENSRGALAAFAVTAMALNGGNIALLTVDGISAKYKNKQVRGAAAAALENAAKALGITKEELSDKIVPDLGFNKNREKLFDYGARSFRGVLGSKLEVQLYDESGKLIKSLPKASAKDDAAKSEAAKDEYKALKKQLKTVVDSQRTRLERAVMSGRRWSKDKWVELFVDNPIMNSFATGLIWAGVKQDGSIIATFRYMEDGTFNTVDEDEYELPEGVSIMLAHPMDLTEDELCGWKQQLEDYEIMQPVMQLDMPVYRAEGDDLKGSYISKFEDTKVYFGTVRGIMDKYGWSRTSVQDAGGYEGYWYEDASTGTGAWITFEWLYVGMMSDEIVTMKKIEYYKRGSIGYGSYVYDYINDKNRIKPSDVPEKFMSFTLMTASMIAEKKVS